MQYFKKRQPLFHVFTTFVVSKEYVNKPLHEYQRVEATQSPQ